MHQRLNGLEFEEALGVGDGHGSLLCCSSWSRKESDATEQLNGTELVSQTVEVACSAGDPYLIPGSGRSSGEGNSNPLHYSCLENPMD